MRAEAEAVIALLSSSQVRTKLNESILNTPAKDHNFFLNKIVIPGAVGGVWTVNERRGVKK